MTCPMACPCQQKMGETDSAKCCYNTCPSKNPVSNKLECENLYCGHDGKTYKGVCALSQCGKTVSFWKYICIECWTSELTFRKSNVMVLVPVLLQLQLLLLPTCGVLPNVKKTVTVPILSNVWLAAVENLLKSQIVNQEFMLVVNVLGKIFS